MIHKLSTQDSTEQIERLIYLIRGQRVMLANDLASLYGVATKRLNEQIKRNAARFPEDFLFQLTDDEVRSLRSQFATLKKGRGQHRKYPPNAFTEHGAIMVASVLNSPRAIEMSVLVVRAFVKLRQILATHQQLAAKLSELEQMVAGHDRSIRAIFATIRQLMDEPVRKKRQIGFGAKDVD